jgi:hypothetical protein
MNYLEKTDYSQIPDAQLAVTLAHLGDRLFEGLPNESAQLWPKRFMTKALAVGATCEERLAKLTTVDWQWRHWLLTEELPQYVVGKGKVYDDVRAAIKRVADAIEPATRGIEIGQRKLEDAAEAAEAAGAASRTAAAWAAEAAEAAEAAAVAVWDSGSAAVWAAKAADGAAAYQRMADKLIELMENAK